MPTKPKRVVKRSRRRGVSRSEIMPWQFMMQHVPATGDAQAYVVVCPCGWIKLLVGARAMLRWGLEREAHERLAEHKRWARAIRRLEVSPATRARKGKR